MRRIWALAVAGIVLILFAAVMSHPWVEGVGQPTCQWETPDGRRCPSVVTFVLVVHHMWLALGTGIAGLVLLSVAAALGVRHGHERAAEHEEI